MTTLQNVIDMQAVPKVPNKRNEGTRKQYINTFKNFSHNKNPFTPQIVENKFLLTSWPMPDYKLFLRGPLDTRSEEDIYTQNTTYREQKDMAILKAK